MKKQLLLLLIVFLTLTNSFSQSGFETIFLADKNDSKKILKSFFSPRIKGYLNGSNNAWFHTAKTHKPFGFDFSVNLVTIINPSSKNTFTVNNLGSINTPDGNFTGNTAIGPKNETSFSINTTVNGQPVTANETFFGGVENSLQIPIAQFGIGVTNGFDIIFRISPELKINNNNESLSLLGIGIKKEITNWFKIPEKLPIHIALLTGFTSMKASYGISNREFPSGNQSGIEITEALSVFEIQNFTLQLLSSLEYGRFSFFGSVGYNNGIANFDTLGKLRGKYQGNSDSEIKDIELPNDISFKESSLNATLGAKINFRYFKIIGNYSLQDVSTANLGLVISIH